MIFDEIRALLFLHLVNLPPDLIHELFAAAGPHHEQRFFASAGIAQSDDLTDFAHLVIRVATKNRELIAATLVANQSLGGIECSRNRGARIRERGEIQRITGQQIAALANLGILHRRQNRLELTDDTDAARDFRDVLFPGR